MKKRYLILILSSIITSVNAGIAINRDVVKSAVTKSQEVLTSKPAKIIAGCVAAAAVATGGAAVLYNYFKKDDAPFFSIYSLLNHAEVGETMQHGDIFDECFELDSTYENSITRHHERGIIRFDAYKPDAIKVINRIYNHAKKYQKEAEPKYAVFKSDVQYNDGKKGKAVLFTFNPFYFKDAVEEESADVSESEEE